MNLVPGLPEDISAQSIFDKSLLGIRQQRGFAYSNDEEACKLRDGSGCCCAVGWLIADEDYREAMEKVSLHELLGAAPRLDVGGSTLQAWYAPLREHLELLTQLQLRHDRAARLGGDTVEWEQGMAALASRECLTYAPPEAPPSSSEGGTEAS